MTQRDPKFDAYVLKIYQALDRLDYYRLLGVKPTDSPKQVKRAFYAIAAKLHPDRNRDAEEKVHKALYDIFKRINEAYRVLSNPETRKMYNEILREGKVRLDLDSRNAGVPQTPEQTIKSPEARKFYIQAAEDFEKGNFMQADLHIRLALSRDPKSKAIVELAGKIKEAKKKK